MSNELKEPNSVSSYFPPGPSASDCPPARDFQPTDNCTLDIISLFSKVLQPCTTNHDFHAWLVEQLKMKGMIFVSLQNRKMQSHAEKTSSSLHPLLLPKVGSVYSKA